MSDISIDFGPFGWAAVILIIGAPGLLLGAAIGAVSWRRHRLYGALIGAVVGLVLWDAGFVFWKASPWG
jgi:Na+/proline symporter